MSRSNTQPVSGQFGAGTVKVSLTFWPGFGLLLGLVFAGIVLGLFCMLVMKRGLLWGLIGLGVGLVAGLVLMLADARPWEDPIKEAEKEAEKHRKAANEAFQNRKPPPKAPPKRDTPWFFPRKDNGFLGTKLRGHPDAVAACQGLRPPLHGPLATGVNPQRHILLFSRKPLASARPRLSGTACALRTAPAGSSRVDVSRGGRKLRESRPGWRNGRRRGLHHPSMIRATKSSARKGMWVQVPPQAFPFPSCPLQSRESSPAAEAGP